jgi:NAD+ diphosphatase
VSHRAPLRRGARCSARLAPRAQSRFRPQRRNTNDLIFLGHLDDLNLFAYELEGTEPPASPHGTRFEDLRNVAALMPAGEAGLLSYARAMITWRRAHRYCGRCGAETVADKAGHVLVCTNPVCRHEQFPRTDPAIIVLVARRAAHSARPSGGLAVGRYSTIAGFVEPGESLEDAVAREVLEETGVQVDRIEYHSSQPWPFPSSLMLGFTARADLTKEVQLRRDQDPASRTRETWFTPRGYPARKAEPLLAAAPAVDLLPHPLVGDPMVAGMGCLPMAGHPHAGRASQFAVSAIHTCRAAAATRRLRVWGAGGATRTTPNRIMALIGRDHTAGR